MSRGTTGVGCVCEIKWLFKATACGCRCEHVTHRRGLVDMPKHLVRLGLRHRGVSALAINHAHTCAPPPPHIAGRLSCDHVVQSTRTHGRHAGQRYARGVGLGGGEVKMTKIAIDVSTSNPPPPSPSHLLSGDVFGGAVSAPGPLCFDTGRHGTRGRAGQYIGVHAVTEKEGTSGRVSGSEGGREGEWEGDRASGREGE